MATCSRNWRWVFGVGLVYCILPHRAFSAEAQATKSAPERPVRLALIDFEIAPETEHLRRHGKAIVDLLTSSLSAAPDFEMVDRTAIAQALRESALSLSRMTKPEQTTRVGKFMRADWFLFGSFAAIDGTNFVLAKIVDARSGIMWDLNSISFEESNVVKDAATPADL